MASNNLTHAQTDTIARKLASLTGGSLAWPASFDNNWVTVHGAVRVIKIRIDCDGITLDSPNGFEWLPSGMSFAAIASHTLTAANGATSPIGESITHREYAAQMNG